MKILWLNYRDASTSEQSPVGPVRILQTVTVPEADMTGIVYLHDDVRRTPDSTFASGGPCYGDACQHPSHATCEPDDRSRDALGCADPYCTRPHTF